MMMINQSALATAVINITGNTQGLSRALGESKKQMHGFLVFAQAMGGKTGGFLANMLAAGGARPALNGFLGNKIGGHASALLERAGLMQNPVHDIGEAMKRAKSDYERRVFAHKMTGSNIFMGGVYNGQPITNRTELAAARARHGLKTPKMEESIDKFVPAAAKSAQDMALMFGRLGAVAVVAIPTFKALISAGSELQDKMRRASQVFGSYASNATAGFGGIGSNMSRSEFAAGAAGIGSELTQAGVGVHRSSTMASNLTATAGNVAAAWGDDFTNVVNKIQSAMGGSDNALKEFGVVLSDDLVRAKAYNMNLIKLHETMSAGVVAQARYELIMDQLNQSVANSSSSFFSLSNQWKTTTSGLATEMEKLGSTLAPIAAGVLGVVNAAAKFATNGYSKLRLGGGAESLDEIRQRLGLEKAPDETDTIGRAKTDAARAEDILRRERARQSSNVGYHAPEDFYNHIQKGIFGDPVEFAKRTADLTAQLVIVSKEQLAALRDFGYHPIDKTSLIQP